MSNQVGKALTVVESHALITSYEERISALLPKHIQPMAFFGVLKDAFSRSPKLRECTQPSLLNAILTAAELGIRPNTPENLGYIIPYWNGQIEAFEANFQLGYRGVITLAMNTGHVDAINAACVHEYDDFKVEYGLHQDLVHKPAMRNRGEIIGAYSIVFLRGSEHHIIHWMTREEIEHHRDHFSKEYKKAVEKKRDTPWISSFGAMAKKTAIIQACNLAPKCAEDKTFSKAISLDAIDISASEVDSGNPEPPDNSQKLLAAAQKAESKIHKPKPEPEPKLETEQKEQPEKPAPEQQKPQESAEHKRPGRGRPKKNQVPEHPEQEKSAVCEKCNNKGLPDGCPECGIVDESPVDWTGLPTFTEDGETFYDVEAMDKSQLVQLIKAENLQKHFDMNKIHNPKISIESIRKKVVDVMSSAGEAQEETAPETNKEDDPPFDEDPNQGSLF